MGKVRGSTAAAKLPTAQASSEMSAIFMVKSFSRMWTNIDTRNRIELGRRRYLYTLTARITMGAPILMQHAQQRMCWRRRGELIVPKRSCNRRDESICSILLISYRDMYFPIVSKSAWMRHVAVGRMCDLSGAIHLNMAQQQDLIPIGLNCDADWSPRRQVMIIVCRYLESSFESHPAWLIFHPKESWHAGSDAFVCRIVL